MSQEPEAQTSSANAKADVPREDAPDAGRGTRIGAGVIAALIIVSLVLYFVGDRLTPYTSQARVQAFVVPVAAEVSGKVTAVHIRNDDVVEPGQPLFDIDPEQYEIALQRARSDYESVRRSVNAATAGVDAARASLQTAQTNFVMAEKDASRQEGLHEEDPGAISVRRLEIAQSTREEARSKVSRAEADLRKAEEAAGDSGDSNAQLQSARTAVEKAELDLANTKVRRTGTRRRHRPARGRRQLRAGRRAGHDADRDPRRVDQRRHDREQPGPHRSRRPDGDRARRDARPGAQGADPQRRRRRRHRAVSAAGDPADGREQPRLAATGAADSRGRGIRRGRTGSGSAACALADRPKCWSTRATIR